MYIQHHFCNSANTKNSLKEYITLFWMSLLLSLSILNYIYTHGKQQLNQTCIRSGLFCYFITMKYSLSKGIDEQYTLFFQLKQRYHV